MEMTITFPGGKRVDAQVGPHTIRTDQSREGKDPALSVRQLIRNEQPRGAEEREEQRPDRATAASGSHQEFDGSLGCRAARRACAGLGHGHVTGGGGGG